MQNILDYSSNSIMAWGGYANLSANPYNNRDIDEENQESLIEMNKGFTRQQAENFLDQYTIVTQETSVSGMRLTVFEDKTTGKQTVAIAGTEPWDIGDLTADAFFKK